MIPQAGPWHPWESRSFAPAALRMTGSLASGGRERETTLPLSLSLKQRAACHPERSARNARVAKDLLVVGPHEEQVLRICGKARKVAAVRASRRQTMGCTEK